MGPSPASMVFPENDWAVASPQSQGVDPAKMEAALDNLSQAKCWSTPALSNGRLYVRSTKEGACFAVGAAPNGP